MHHAGMGGNLTQAERCRAFAHQQRLRRHKQLVAGSFTLAALTGYQF
jgi:hypothetical protein